MPYGSNSKNDKIKVAFLDIGSEKWTGGLYYYRNLFHAISMLENRPIHPYVFVGNNADNNILEPLEPYVTIVKSSLFDSNSFSRNLSRLIYLVTGSNLLRTIFLKKYGIQIVSHSNFIDKHQQFTTINWIPDFQYKHLPEMFSHKEIRKRTRLVKKIITESDTVIISSNDALRDLQTETFNCPHQAASQILHFTANIDLRNHKANLKHFEHIKRKYNINNNFFFLPNQFWKHKNHKVVLDATLILKSSGNEISILCSGYMHDHRNKGHVDKLKQFIQAHHLETNIVFLGLIEREELITLIRFSLAVINPSFFEGWSSTVEEAKSIGKQLILSNLNVHREQNPPSSIYFDPHDPKQLAKILLEVWCNKKSGPDYLLEEKAQKNLKNRMRNFGNKYLDIINESLKKTKV